MVVGVVLGLMEPEDMTGKQDYDIARWAQRLRLAQRALPQLLGLLGFNAVAISKNVYGKHPIIAAILAGGVYPSLDMELNVVSGGALPAFASWEIFTAKAIYWYLVPALQFGLAILTVDTWQYFVHRAMHVNKWLYSRFRSNAVSLVLIEGSNDSLPSSPSVRTLCIRCSLQSPF